MKKFIFEFKHLNVTKDSEKFKKIIDTLKKTKHTFNISQSEHMRSFIYSNEPKSMNRTFESKNQFALIGQFVKNEKSIINDIYNLSMSDLGEYISKLSGAFAIGLANFEKDYMSFYTHLFRIDNIYYPKSDNGIVVGTDPLIVSAISNEDVKPQIDIDNSVSFLMNGYFADETTLFKDVKVMPPNSVMTVNSQGIEIDELDNSYNELFTEKPNKIINDQIKENYIEAFKAVPKKVDINIGVTGGKDSRLALLGLLEAGYNVKTNTRGFKDNPDVQMAQ